MIQPLSPDHRRFLANVAWQTVELLNAQPDMLQIARDIIGTVCWYWTADAVVGGAVRRDAIKYSIPHQHHTEAAALCAERRLLVHEHAVPRRVVVDLVCAAGALEEVERVLLGCCVAAVVTKSEDAVLNDAGLKQKMPAGWTPGESPFARYELVGVDVFPPEPEFDLVSPRRPVDPDDAGVLAVPQAVAAVAAATQLHYLLCGDASPIQYGGRGYKGTPCSGACNSQQGHYFYAIPVDPAAVAAYPNTYWTKIGPTGRQYAGRLYLLENGRNTGLFVSNSACALPCVKYHLNLDEGPRRLPCDIADWMNKGAKPPAP